MRSAYNAARACFICAVGIAIILIVSTFFTGCGQRPHFTTRHGIKCFQAYPETCFNGYRYVERAFLTECTDGLDHHCERL